MSRCLRRSNLERQRLFNFRLIYAPTVRKRHEQKLRFARESRGSVPLGRTIITPVAS
jgi:hypothetical protein